MVGVLSKVWPSPSTVALRRSMAAWKSPPRHSQHPLIKLSANYDHTLIIFYSERLQMSKVSFAKP